MTLLRHFRGEWTAEWCAVIALVLADIAFSAQAGLHLRLTPGAYWLVPGLLAAAAAARRYRHPRIVLLLEYFALLIVTDTAVRVLTFAGTAMAGPLLDAQFLVADRLLGFDWIAYFQFVMNHVRLGAVLVFLYSHIGAAALFLWVQMSLKGDAARLRETFWLPFIASLLTAWGGYLFPVEGPFKSLGYESFGYFLPDIEHLRSGRDLVFPLGALGGVIGFPSFHTTLALALIHAFRGTGIIGKTLSILCVLMLPGVPVFGGHYLMDMFAGAAVMLASLAVVKGFAKWKAGAASASPGYTEASASACLGSVGPA